jgi:hypothetical protein
MSLYLLFFIFSISVLLALLEIQIEGVDGWAKNLPTWKIRNPFQKIFNWEYLSGYHLYLWTLLLVILQSPFFMGLKFSLPNEILVIEILFLTLMCEDFLWFVLNPKWGIKRFFKEDIPWHSDKFLFFPKNYWAALILLILLEIIKIKILN